MDKMMAACGMEVSAQELVVALTGKKGEAVLRRFANTAAGHAQLLRVLRGLGTGVRVVLEATGLYGLDVALALSGQAGVEVMVANPRAVRHFARAMMQRSKNDQLDALVLWEFAARMPFTRWARPEKTRWRCGPWRGVWRP
jgi:transposase